MKRLGYLLIPLLGIISCNTDNKVSTEKEVAARSAKKDSVSLDLQLLALASSTIGTIKAVGDSLTYAHTPEKILSLVNCDDAIGEFRDSTKAASRYKVKVKITASGNHSDNANFKSTIKSFSITVNEINLVVPDRFFIEFENLMPCNFKVFESKDKRNLLIYPSGLYSEKSEKITINLAKGRIARINNTTILY
jgi:hypothetical protein